MKRLRQNLAYFTVFMLSTLITSCGEDDAALNAPNAPGEGRRLYDETYEVNTDKLVVMVTLDEEGRNFYANENETPVFNQKMFDKAEPFVDGLAKVGKQENDSTILYTYINAKGDEITDYKYEDAGHFSDGLAWVKINGKYGYIDEEGNEVIKPNLLNNWNFNSGRVLFSNEKFNPYMDINYSKAKYGYLNSEGDTVIPLQYKWALSFNGGLAPVYENGKMIFIDTEGNQAIDQEFENADEFRDGIAPVIAGGDLGFINKDGEFIISPKYDEYKYLYEYDVFNFSSREDDKDRSKVYQTDEGFFIVSKNEKWGIIDEDENQIVPFEFTDIGIPDSNIVEINRVKEQKEYTATLYSGLFDLNQKKVVLPAKYDNVSKFHDEGNEVWYELGIKTDPEVFGTDLHGFFNVETGKVIEPAYYDVNIFEGGLASVKESKDGLWGFVNTDGELVIDYQYDIGANFEDGKAFVSKDGEYFYIDKKGNKIED